MRTIRVLLCALPFVFSAIILNAKTEEVKTKVYEKNYTVNENTTLELHNIYGKIDVQNWEKNEVYIKVTIKVTGDKIKDAQELFDRTKINFTDSTDLVRVVTEFEKSSFFDFLENISDNDFEIDYDVSAPVYLKLNLHQKYGDIHVNEVHGYSEFYVKYGDLFAKNLFCPTEKPLSSVNIKYGNAEIQNTQKLIFNTKYSNIKLQNAIGIVAISKYSNYKIESITAAVCDSKYDTYDIQNIQNIKYTGKYVTLKIDTLQKALEASMGFGSIDVKHLLKSVNNVTVAGSYTDIKLKVSKDMKYQLTAAMDYSDFSEPNGFTTTTHNVDNNHESVIGYCGDSGSTNQFTFTCKYGDLKIKTFE